jgi:predicted FMN-binding regulatory protein PaiB
MYQPAHQKFVVDDPAALLTELCAVVPATLVTHGAGGFRASILPMLFDPDDGPDGTLRGHLARGIRSGARSRHRSPIAGQGRLSRSSMARTRTCRRPGTRRSG